MSTPHLIVVRVNEWDEPTIADLQARIGTPESYPLPQINLVRFMVPEETDVAALLATLRADPFVVHAYESPRIETNRSAHATPHWLASNDPLIVNQWHLIRCDFFGAWRYTRGAGAKVSDHNTGSWPTATMGPCPEYRPPDVQKGLSFSDPTNAEDQSFVNPVDGSMFSHGVICSSIMSQGVRNNGVGISGAAPESSFFASRIVDPTGGWWFSEVADHWIAAADWGACASNNSWGVGCYFPTNGGSQIYLDVATGQALLADMSAAIEYCWSKNCLVVVGVGDNPFILGHEGPRSPHNQNDAFELPEQLTNTTTNPHVLVVSASGLLGDMHGDMGPGFGAGWGPLVELQAPGTEMWGLNVDANAPGYAYNPHWGTSFSAPITCAAIALMKSVYPAITPAQIKSILAGPNAPGTDMYRIESTRELFLACRMIDHVGRYWDDVDGGAEPYNSLDSSPIFVGNPVGNSRYLDGSNLPYASHQWGLWGFTPGVPGFIPAIAYEGATHPSTCVTPNARVLNACKAVLSAMTLDPANAGNVYPYLQVWGPGGMGSRDRKPLYQFNTDGSTSTILEGQCAIEVTGFSSDPITTVELWLGSTLFYSGPPTILKCSASSYGTAQPVKIVAHTSTGNSATETYSDIVVADLSPQLDLPIPATYGLASDAAFAGNQPPFLPIAANLGMAMTGVNVDAPSVLRRGLRMGTGYVYGGFAAAPTTLAAASFALAGGFAADASAIGAFLSGAATFAQSHAFSGDGISIAWPADGIVVPTFLQITMDALAIGGPVVADQSFGSSLGVRFDFGVAYTVDQELDATFGMQMNGKFRITPPTPGGTATGRERGVIIRAPNRVRAVVVPPRGTKL